jgi:hypothetical protein
MSKPAIEMAARRPHVRMPEKPPDVIKEGREAINANAPLFAKPP